MKFSIKVFFNKCDQIRKNCDSIIFCYFKLNHKTKKFTDSLSKTFMKTFMDHKKYI